MILGHDDAARTAIVELAWMSRRAGEFDAESRGAHDEALAIALAHGVEVLGRSGEPLSWQDGAPAPSPLPSLFEAAAAIQRFARRYAHGRMTYATSMCNRATQALVEAGAELDASDGTIWALDGNGPGHDALDALRCFEAIEGLVAAGREASIPDAYRHVTRRVPGEGRPESEGGPSCTR